MPFYIKLTHQALEAGFVSIAPIILILLVIGLATGIMQAALQMEDAAFGLVAKTIAMIVIALFGGFGALQMIEGLATFWISHADMFVHQSWS